MMKQKEKLQRCSMESNLDLAKFSESFFQKLGCKAQWQGDVLFVENIPNSFEAFVGKKGPYEFVFDASLKEGEREFLSKGGYFLNAMANYLENKNKNTMLKLNFDINPLNEILTRFSFINSEIERIDKKENYDYFLRFTFSTNFQYLNEKERENISLYVYEGKLINFDISKFNYSDGKKDDIKIGDIKKDYELTKNVLKEKISGKITRISAMLSDMLNKELQRVENHYNHQIMEADDKLNEIKKQITLLEEKTSKTDPKEIEKIEKRIEKLKLELEQTNPAKRKEELKKEKEFYLSEEKHKYGLNISTSLINTSIVYYPKYDFIVHLKSKDATDRLVLTYDPIQKHMPPVVCEGTAEKIYRIYLCAAGKICSDKALVECVESGKLYCKSVMNTICGHCHKPVYKKFADYCPITKKYYVKRYMKTDCMTGQSVYMNLLERCPSSGLFTTKDQFKKCPCCGARVCPKGLKKGFIDGGIIEFCNICKGRRMNR